MNKPSVQALLTGFHLSQASIIPQRPRKEVLPFFDDYILKGWLSGPGERYSLLQNWQRHWGEKFPLQRGRERIYSGK